MGELDTLDCVYCGSRIWTLPLRETIDGNEELVYYCACGGVTIMGLEE
jgi:hypothetical protein